jgi:hypothetical protein
MLPEPALKQRFGIFVRQVSDLLPDLLVAAFGRSLQEIRPRGAELPE